MVWRTPKKCDQDVTGFGRTKGGESRARNHLGEEEGIGEGGTERWSCLELYPWASRGCMIFRCCDVDVEH